MLQARRSRVRVSIRSLIFSIYVILSAALSPGFYLAFNRNEYQKQKMFMASRAPPAHKDDKLTAICEPIV
jgi:hypothetical protein